MSRLEQLQRLVKLAPQDPMSHYGLGLEYINLLDWENAIAAFTQAIQADAKYSAAYYHKARVEINAGRPDEARNTLTVGMAAAKSAGDWHTEKEMRELMDTIA